MNEIGNVTKAMQGDKPRHPCPDCDTSYSTEVNLRAHQYRMHQKANLGLATTRDLLEELEARFEVSRLPNALDAIRYLREGLNPTHLEYRTVSGQ